MSAQLHRFSFNSLHDLDQDGYLSIPELEAVYGLHHPQAKKSTPDAHMEAKRRAIMDKVLRQLDTNKDGEPG
jgi:Ca2+-binding EF-hand superfamily protein